MEDGIANVYYMDDSQVFVENADNVVETDGVVWHDDYTEVVEYQENNISLGTSITEYETATEDDSTLYYSTVDTTLANDEVDDEHFVNKTDSDEVRNVTVITYESHGNESILPHVSEEAERPVEETNSENNGEVITVGENDVMLYQIEGSEDLYAVQIADDGQGNLQKYQYKVRETEDGQLEAVPGTIQLQTVDETPEISQNDNDNAAVYQKIDAKSIVKIENEEMQPKNELASVDESVLQENDSNNSGDSEIVTTDVQTNLETESFSTSNKQTFTEVYVDHNQEIGLTFQNNDCVIDESVASQEDMNNSIELSEYMQVEPITQDENNDVAEPTENADSQVETSSEISFETEKNNEVTLQIENYVDESSEMCTSRIEDSVTQIENNDNIDQQESNEEYTEEMETIEEVDTNAMLIQQKTEKQYAEGSQVRVLADVVIPRKVIEKPMPPKTTIKYSLASHVQKRMKQNLKQECHMPVSETKYSFEPKFQKMSKNIPVYNKVCKKDQSVTLLIVNPTSNIKSKEAVLTTKPKIDLLSRTENRNPRSLLRLNNVSKKEPIVLNKMQTIDTSGKSNIHREDVTAYNLNISSSNEVKCRQPRKQTIKPVERGDSEITFHIDQKPPDNNNIETFDLSDEECESKPKQRKKRKNALVEKIPKKRGRKPVIVISDSSEGDSNDDETEIDDVQSDKTGKKSQKKIRRVPKNKNLKKKVEDVKNDLKNFFGFNSGSDSEEQSTTPQSDNENKKASVEENHELSLEERDDSPQIKKIENCDNLLENGQPVLTEKNGLFYKKKETTQESCSIKNGINDSQDLQRLTDNEKSQKSVEATEQLKTDEKSDIVLTEMKEIHGAVSDLSILDNVTCKNSENLQCTAELLLDLENSPENIKPKIKSSQLDDSQNTVEKLNDQKNTDISTFAASENVKENKSPKKCEIIDNEKTKNNKLEIVETINKSLPEVKKSRLETKSKLSNKFACPHCPKTFTIPVAFKMHVRSHGNKDKISFKCDVCPKVFLLRSAFVLHKRSHSRADIVKNHKVGRDKLNDRKNVESNNFKCEKCPETFLTSSSLNGHKNVHKKIYKCNICFQKFVNKSKLILHSREHIKNNLLKIVTEDASKRNLRRSTQNKTEFSKIIQNIENTDKKRRLSQSIKKEDTETTSLTSSSPDLHTCNICSKSFRQLAHLVMHRDAHNKPKCPNCGKIFGFKNLLDEHMRRHCLKKIALKKSAISGTNKHDSSTATRKSIISDKEMSCDKCDKTFKNSADYYNHVKTHQKTSLHKEMKCDECNRSFKSPIGYYSHIRIHRATNLPASRKSLYNKTEKDSLIKKSLPDLEKSSENVKTKSTFVNNTETVNNKKIENPNSKPSSFIRRKTLFSKQDEISSTNNQENLMKKSNTILARKSTFSKLESSVRDVQENISKDLNNRKTISKLEGNTNCKSNDDKNENYCVNPRTILVARRQSFRRQIPSNKVIAYNCSMCDLKFTTHTGLFKHTRTHEDSFRCEYCDIVFDSKSLLGSHLKTHISVMFNCGTCHECFKSEEHLMKHMIETKHDSLNSEAKNGDLEASAKKIKLPKKKLGHGGVPLSDKMHKAFSAAKVKT